MSKVYLEWLYEEDYLDLTDIYNGFGQLLWLDLIYVDAGKEVKIEGFKITELEFLDELEYVDAHLENHMTKVYKWMDWLQTYMKAITGYDVESYKDIEKERWKDDDELRAEFPDFEDYWEKQSVSEEMAEMIGWDQQESWRELRDEYQADAFEVMDSEIYEYFDSYDNINIRQLDDNLEIAFDEILTRVKNFAANKREYSEEDYTNIMDDIFR